MAFLIVSSLVICSMLLAGFATAVSFDLFGLRGDDDPSENLPDPNSDVIAEQQTAVANDPTNFEERLLLANLLGNSARLDEAIPIYEALLSERPDDTAARFDFARSLDDGDKDADAEVQYLKVIELDPNHQGAHYYLAEMYRLAQPPRTDEAIPHYQRVVEINPGNFQGQTAVEQLRSLGATVPGATPPAFATPG